VRRWAILLAIFLLVVGLTAVMAIFIAISEFNGAMRETTVPAPEEEAGADCIEKAKPFMIQWRLSSGEGARP
jgi:hypothetical protein